MPRDPRTHITPDAYTLAPELLGVALARPSRRLAAIALDGVLALLLAKSGWVTFVAIALALFAWRVVAGPIDRMIQRGRMRIVFRAATVLVILIVFINGVDTARGLLGRTKDRIETRLEGDAKDAVDDLKLSREAEIELLALLGAMKFSDSTNAGENGGELGRWVIENTSPGEQRDRVRQGLVGSLPPQAATAFHAALAAAPAPLDTLTADTVAGDTVARLLAQNAHLREENSELREAASDRKDRSERGPLLGTIGGLISDDLGVGFSWFALYFTAFVVLGRGQTPGKRLLRIKIVRLDNKPIGWWLAFERFGGYAASSAIGLLGFAQILWDRNRQALHDKAADTVVIRVKNGEPVRMVKTGV